MAEAVELAHVVRELDKPLDAVWARLADFANVDRIYPKDGIGPFAAIDRVEAQGEGVGTVRTVYLANGVRGIERLEAIDPEQHSFSYSMLPPPVVPVDDYYATVSLSAIGPGADDGELQEHRTTERHAVRRPPSSLEHPLRCPH
jgi:hypothetical protein